MTDLISRSALIEVFRQSGTAYQFPFVEEQIKAAPTVDAVEVVRCKDCKHSDKIIFPEMPEMLICWGDERSDRMVCANGYCDMGERKDEVEE